MDKDEKIVPFRVKTEYYKKLADEHADKDDLIGALGFALASLKRCRTLSAITDVADLYADMGLFDASNKFWFEYLDKASDSKASMAYEELGINFFYMSEYGLSGYYFEQKVKADGFISREGMDEEILDYFEKEVKKERGFHIVYPENRADYSELLQTAKKLNASNRPQDAYKILKDIPESAKEYADAVYETIISCYLSGKYREGIDKCKEYISLRGESMDLCCHLSSLYAGLKNRAKKIEYYEKALTFSENTMKDTYRLAYCAFDMCDHATAGRCMGKIVADRPYDVNMRIYYGIALLNLGDYHGAREQFGTALRILPEDYVADYYYKVADGVLGGKRKRPPVYKYVTELPDKEINARIDKLSVLEKADSQKLKSLITTSPYSEYLKWGLDCPDAGLCSASTFTLMAGEKEETDKWLRKKLRDGSYLDAFKRTVLFYFLNKQFGKAKRHVSVCIDGVFVKVRPVILSCEKERDREFYEYACYCVSTLVFMGYKDFDAMLKNLEKTYAFYKDGNLSGEIAGNLSREDVSALTAYACGLAGKGKSRDVCRIFGIKEKRFSQLKSLFKGDKGEKDDKDN